MKKWTTIAVLAVAGAGATGFALHSQSTAIAKSKPDLAGVPSVSSKSIAPVLVSFGRKVAPLQLQNTEGKPVTVGQWNKSKATVLIFVATQCPVSYAYNDRMAALQTAYAPKGVRFIGIDSNASETSSQIVEYVKEHAFGFPFYQDPQNKIADRFGAKVTPEVYVVGPKGDLRYRGRIDNSQRENEVNNRSLQTALNAILSKKPVAEKETRAFGCSIKREG